MERNDAYAGLISPGTHPVDPIALKSDPRQFFRMSRRRIALVGPLTGERRAVHTAGYPIDPEEMLPSPDVLLLVDAGRDGCMLFRYTAHGEFGGDTPHETARQAEAQAQMEYGEALLPWIEVPDDVADAHLFAVKYAAEQLNERG